jgi:DNA-binding SARP family transcriptional activator
LEFRILGPLEVVDDDGPIEITAPQQRALLAALLLHANQVLPAGRLIDLLWGPAPPETARNTVQAYVHRLRRALSRSGRHPDVLVTRTAGYVLEVPPDALDLLSFELLASQGRHALGRGQPEQGVAQLRQALGLWRGQALADVANEPLRAQARRLEEARLRVWEECAGRPA